MVWGLGVELNTRRFLDPKLFLSRVLMRTDPTFPICRGDHPQSRHHEYRLERRQLALGTLGRTPRLERRHRFVPDGRSMPVDFHD